MDRGRFDIGRELAEKAIASDPTYHRGFVCLGRAYIGLNRPDLAIPHLATGLEFRPLDVDALYFMAFAHRRMKQLEKALGFTDDCLRIIPHNAVILIERGHCLFEMDRKEEAKVCFFKARELDPDDESVHNAIGFWHLKAGQFIEAEHAFRTGLRIESNDAVSYTHLTLPTICSV